METHITLGKGNVAVGVRLSKGSNIPDLTFQPMSKTFKVGEELKNKHKEFIGNRIVSISIDNLGSLKVVQECLDAVKFFLLKEKEK